MKFSRRKRSTSNFELNSGMSSQINFSLIIIYRESKPAHILPPVNESLVKEYSEFSSSISQLQCHSSDWHLHSLVAL